MPIKTERLSISMIQPSEKQLLWELDQDPEVLKYINGGRCPSMKEVEEIYVPRLESYFRPDKGWGLWKIIDSETSQYYGWILVRPMDFFNDNPQFDNLELGWRLKRQAWGKGIATEAAKAVMQYLSNFAEVSKFSAIAMEENLASIGIMTKLGMQYIDKIDHNDPVLGEMKVVLYECLNID